jgi:hypothetical protein
MRAHMLLGKFYAGLDLLSASEVKSSPCLGSLKVAVSGQAPPSRAVRTVLFDASVLYAVALRDLLLELALSGLFRAKLPL